MAELDEVVREGQVSHQSRDVITCSIGISGVAIYRRYVIRLTNGGGHRSPDVISSKLEEIKMHSFALITILMLTQALRRCH